MSAPAPVRVVAAAIVHDGSVLAARRAGPHRWAGGWEFPGGKVEAGEDDVTALVRECQEELGVAIGVGPVLGAIARDGVDLVLHACTLITGQPAPLEDHDELQWLDADGLAGVPWLPIDLDLLPAVAPLLR